MTSNDNAQWSLDKIPALIEAVRVNFLAISITSVTTIIGFLALNFSDSPPFHHLGNMTAVGIFAAWAVSITILPAVISLLPVRFKAESQGKVGLGARLLERLADLVIARYRATLLLCGGAAVLLTALVPTIALVLGEKIGQRAEGLAGSRSAGASVEPRAYQGQSAEQRTKHEPA